MPEPRRCLEELTRVFVSFAPVVIRIIFFARFGRVVVYRSAKDMAEPALLVRSTGYCSSIRAIMVSTSPIPIMRLAESSFTSEEKAIK